MENQVLGAGKREEQFHAFNRCDSQAWDEDGECDGVVGPAVTPRQTTWSPREAAHLPLLSLAYTWL